MAEHPVVILGAGATKACGGPLTDEILPAALNGNVADDAHVVRVEDREELIDLTTRFLTECFYIPNERPVEIDDCPSLPLVLSMLRRSASSNLSIGAWSGDRLIKAKRAIDYSIFAVIEAALRQIDSGRQPHRQLLEQFYNRDIEPCVISFNYDVIVDNTMFSLGAQYQNQRVPDYRTDISTDQYVSICKDVGVFGLLLKLHGSLNWLFCETCRRLDVFVSDGMREHMQTGKALNELYNNVPFDDAYSCRGTKCRNAPQCDGYVAPILITPTFVKDYENPHIRQVWSEAEQAMKNADRAVIIGYSLPTDDVEIAMLFKRGFEHLSPNRITVVEYVSGDADKPASRRTKLTEHAVGRRYRSLFGPDVDWNTIGFEPWLEQQRSNNKFPFH